MGRARISKKRDPPREIYPCGFVRDLSDTVSVDYRKMHAGSGNVHVLDGKRMGIEQTVHDVNGLSK